MATQTTNYPNLSPYAPSPSGGTNTQTGYFAQCASNGMAGPLFSGGGGGYESAQSACNNCYPGVITDGNGLNQINSNYCPLSAPAAMPALYATNSGYWQGGGPNSTLIPDSAGNYSANTDEGQDLWGNNINAGLGGGNASFGLTHTQIALVILLILLVCGTGGFLLFRHLKK